MIEMWGYIISRIHHVVGNFAVTTLIRIHQGHDGQGCNVQEERNQYQKQQSIFCCDGQKILPDRYLEKYEIYTNAAFLADGAVVFYFFSFARSFKLFFRRLLLRSNSFLRSIFL